MQSLKLQFKVQNFIGPVAIILFAVVLRLLPHPPNVAPIGAMALFGGLYLNKKYALVIPFLALLFSDLFLGFHATMFFVYGSFAITGLLGLWIRNKKTPKNIVLISLMSSILFFLITNFGVWLTSPIYTKDVAGFINCYIAAIPFFRNTLLGDLLYTGLFVGGYELVQFVILSKVPALRNEVKDPGSKILR